MTSFLHFRSAVLAGLLLAACAAFHPAAAAPVAEPQPLLARLVSVVEENAPVRGKIGFPGAAFRAFEDPADTANPTIFDIRWYTPPPGLPAGVLLYVECLQERTSDIRTYFAPQRQPVSGYIDTRIEIPAADIGRAGPLTHWQISLVYRGYVLDRWASANGWTPPAPPSPAEIAAANAAAGAASPRPAPVPRPAASAPARTGNRGPAPRPASAFPGFRPVPARYAAPPRPVAAPVSSPAAAPRAPVPRQTVPHNPDSRMAW